jgi:hypothetical protein
MKFNDRSRPRFNPQQRAQLLKEFARNPGTARDFAARHGIAASSLYRWQRRADLTEPVPQANGQAGSELFKQVAISEVLGTQWSGEVRLPDGTEVRWRHPAPVAALQELLGYLRRPC